MANDSLQVPPVLVPVSRAIQTVRFDNVPGSPEFNHGAKSSVWLKVAALPASLYATDPVPFLRFESTRAWDIASMSLDRLDAYRRRSGWYVSSDGFVGIPRCVFELREGRHGSAFFDVSLDSRAPLDVYYVTFSLLEIHGE